MKLSSAYTKHKTYDIELPQERAARAEPSKEYRKLQESLRRAQERTQPARTPDKDRNQFTIFGDRVTMKEVRESRRRAGGV